MRFKLDIALGNVVMQSFADVVEAIERSAGYIDHSQDLHSGDARTIRDVNGNTIGKWEVIE